MSNHDEHVRRADAVRDSVTEIGVDELLAAEPGWRTIIDVREPSEYAAGHLPGSVNVPLGELEERAGEVLAGADAPVVTYCNGGNRGVLGADALQRSGFSDVVNLAGGLRAVPESGIERPVPPDGPSL